MRSIFSSRERQLEKPSSGAAAAKGKSKDKGSKHDKMLWPSPKTSVTPSRGKNHFAYGRISARGVSHSGEIDSTNMGIKMSKSSAWVASRTDL